MNQKPQANIDLPPGWLNLRAIVSQEAGNLTDRVLLECFALYESGYAAESSSPGKITSEYGKPEFLLIVDEFGNACGRDQIILAHFKSCLVVQAGFEQWFMVGVLPADSGLTPDLPGEPVLMAARWLCHLVGLRHQTVEIYIDPPGMKGHTFVQVRGLNKALAPGTFDIPCAGHISGTEGVLESLSKELHEELNLALDDLEDLSLAAQYASPPHVISGIFLNLEYCYLYKAKLKAQAASQICFSDGEVAALALFNVKELAGLMERFPERAASGLIESFNHISTSWD